MMTYQLITKDKVLATPSVLQKEQTVLYSEEELAEIRELFPELSDKELARFIIGLDCTIDKVLDPFFNLDEASY